MSIGVSLTAAEAAIYESLVVPRYLHAFGGPAVAMLLPFGPAAVAHIGCRTGYPSDAIAQRLPGCTVTGVDSSAPALELARTKAALHSGVAADYLLAEALPTPLPPARFTHALALHPLGVRGDYAPLFQEMHRVLAPGGQVVVSLPLRGSFPELYDMLREYALRHDQPHFGEVVELAVATRPNPEVLSDGLERAGFVDVDVVVELYAVPFEHGRDFLDDPIKRLCVEPDVRATLAAEDGFEAAVSYAATAVAKYWSEMSFELTVNIGSVSARKP
jgi:SAM-dependent methyltransferase